MTTGKKKPSGKKTQRKVTRKVTKKRTVGSTAKVRRKPPKTVKRVLSKDSPRSQARIMAEIGLILGIILLIALQIVWTSKDKLSDDLLALDSTEEKLSDEESKVLSRGHADETKEAEEEESAERRFPTIDEALAYDKLRQAGFTVMMNSPAAQRMFRNLKFDKGAVEFTDSNGVLVRESPQRGVHCGKKKDGSVTCVLVGKAVKKTSVVD